jgi:hypothetical protein
MRQALHIFKKDVRHLRWEIALVLLVAMLPLSDLRMGPGVIVTSSGDSIWKSLLPLFWFLLAGRVIHSEALPGTKQFWLTRPYSQGSLLGAKMLFLLTFIPLPMAISDILILKHHGFAVSAYWPGLVWEFVLRFIVFAGPAAAFAVITSDLRNQAGYALAGVALMFGIFLLIDPQPTDWGILEWLRNSVIVILIAVGAAAITIWQHFRRRTLPACIALAGVFVLGSLITKIPRDDGWWLATRLSSRWIDHGSLTVTLDRSIPLRPEVQADTVQVEIPLKVAGVPDGLTPRGDEVWVDVNAESFLDGGGGGAFISSASRGWKPSWEVDDRGIFEVLRVAHGSFEQWQNTPVRMRTSVILTLTRKLPTTAIPANAPIMVPGVGSCQFVYACKAPFRAPGVLAFMSRNGAPIPWVSYSPFPAELGINPISSDPGGEFMRSDRQPQGLAITTEEPVVHLRQDFTIDNILLKDFIAPEF